MTLSCDTVSLGALWKHGSSTAVHAYIKRMYGLNEPRVFVVRLAARLSPLCVFCYLYIYKREKRGFTWNHEKRDARTLVSGHTSDSLVMFIFVQLGQSDSFLLTNLYVRRSIMRLCPHI